MCESLPLQPWAERVVLEITERSRLQGIEAWDGVDRVTKMFSIAVMTGAGYSLSVLTSPASSRWTWARSGNRLRSASNVWWTCSADSLTQPACVDRRGRRDR